MKFSFQHSLYIVMYFFSLILEDESVAETAAQKRRSHHPINYRKNQPMKLRYIIEKVDLTDYCDSPDSSDGQRYFRVLTLLNPSLLNVPPFAL